MLDVGCDRDVHLTGSTTATQLAAIRQQGGTVIGIDVALRAIRDPHVDDVRSIDSSGRWPVADSSIDIAMFDWVLEHVLDLAVFFDRAQGS